MADPKLTKLELQIMETLWTRDSASIREIQDSFPEKKRPAYTTIQTTVYRLESKKAVRRDPARQGTAGMPAHAVGQHDQTGTSLVELPNAE